MASNKTAFAGKLPHFPCRILTKTFNNISTPYKNNCFGTFGTLKSKKNMFWDNAQSKQLLKNNIYIYVCYICMTPTFS